MQLLMMIFLSFLSILWTQIAEGSITILSPTSSAVWIGGTDVEIIYRSSYASVQIEGYYAVALDGIFEEGTWAFEVTGFSQNPEKFSGEDFYRFRWSPAIISQTTGSVACDLLNGGRCAACLTDLQIWTCLRARTRWA